MYLNNNIYFNVDYVILATYIGAMIEIVRMAGSYKAVKVKDKQVQILKGFSSLKDIK